MTIIHYIPDPKLTQAQNYVSMLQSSMGKAVKMTVITGNIKRKDFLRHLSSINPDIVHIHGCWQRKAASVQQWCQHRGYPVIISPHGILSSETIATNPWKYYVPRIIAYQFRAIRSCYLILATSDKELADLKDLGWRKRLLLASMSDPKLSETLYAIYKKVIDTNLRNHLSVADTNALYTFLNAAACYGKDNEPTVTLAGFPQHPSPITQPPSPITQHPSPSTLSASSWQAIQVYAIDHGIIDILDKGVKALNITIPQVVSNVPDRFPYHSRLKLKKGISRDNISEQYPNNPFELDIAMNIIALHGMLVHNRISSPNTQPSSPNTQPPSPLHLIFDIHQQIRWHDYDEAVLMSILNGIGMKNFTARLMYILGQAFHLTIGYMPIDPVNDNITQQLLIKINQQP